jgi:alpha-N-arabinofuranosidase
VHAYYDPAAYASVDDYLACSLDLDRTIGAVTTIADAVGRRRRSSKRIDLSVDEWNVWRLAEHQAREDPEAPFRQAPAIAEDEQDLADALVVGCLLITLLRHADRVRIACLAQLVNVIPVIRTVNGGPAWRQTTSYPFADVARLGRGTVLRTAVETPRTNSTATAVDAIGLVAVHDQICDSLAMLPSIVRRTRSSLEVSLRSFSPRRVAEHRVLTGDFGTNTADHPRRSCRRTGWVQ